MSFSSERDPKTFTNLRENEVVMPGGNLDNSSSILYDDDPFDDGQNAARIDLQQQHQFALETIRQLRQRLIRRTNTIEEIRKYYLRDIVTMKLVIREVLTESERQKVWQQYDDILPSLDLKDSMRVHAPHGFEFTIKPCEMCGGQLELVKKDTDQVEALRKALRDSKERENKWREKLAVLDAEVESVGKERAETTKSHMEEKRVLYEELKKVNDIIGKLKEDRDKIMTLNKKFKEENETVKKRNEELEVVPPQLVVAERDNEILKGNLQTTQEQLKITKAKEKVLQKNLAEAQDRVSELEADIETMQQELILSKQDCKQQELAMSRIRDMSSELENSLETVNREKLELNKRISELEEEAQAMSETQARTIRDYERAIDQLRHDLREAQKTQKFSSKEQEKVVRELEICKETIAQLTELNKNQELELIDNAEEIQLFEQEIVAMQQFIREKVAEKTFSVDAEANAAVHDLPEILKAIEGVINHNDDEEEDDNHNQDPSEMPLKRTISALSGDEDSVGSAGSAPAPLPAKSLKSRHKALKSKRTSRLVNKAETEKKNQLLLKQASERLKPIDFSELSDDSGGEDVGKSLVDDSTLQTGKESAESDDEEVGDKKKTSPNGKTVKKKKPSSGSGSSGMNKRKTSATRRSIQGSVSKKNGPEGSLEVDTKPRKYSVGSPKPSSPSKKSRAGSATSDSETDEVRSSNVTPNRSAISSAEGKRPLSRDGKDSTSTAPKVHGRHSTKKRVTSIKNSQVGELLEKAAQVAQEVIVIEEDDDEEEEEGANHTVEGIAMKPSEMLIVDHEGQDHDEDETASTDIPTEGKTKKKQSEKKAPKKKSSKDTSKSQPTKVKTRRPLGTKETIPEDAEVTGPVVVHSDMPLVEAAAAVSMASEVLSEIGIKAPSVATVLEDMLLTENQPKEVFVGVPNAKVELKRMESMRRRKSIPKNFNFNPHVVDDVDAMAPLTGITAKENKAPHLSIDTQEVMKEPVKEVTTVDGAVQTTPIMVRETREMVASHARQQKQTRNLIDSAKDRLRQIRSLFDAPQVMHSQRVPKKMETSDSDEDESEEDDNDKDKQPAIQIPRGPTLKGEASPNKPLTVKSNDSKKPPAPTYVVESKKPKSTPMAAASAPRPAVAIPPVALNPPPSDATKLELSLRDQLLQILHDATASGKSTSSETVLHLNKNTIHCAMNVMTPVLHQFSRMLDHAVHAMWDSLMVNRNSLDFYQKALVVFDGIVQCAAEGTTNATVAEICAKLVPVAGATYNSHLTTAWQQACRIPASIVQDLTPVIVNYDTNERRSKTYKEFLQNTAISTVHSGTETMAEGTGGDDQSTAAGGDTPKIDDTASSVVTDDTSNTVFPLSVYEEKLVTALDTVQKMQDYGEDVKERLNEDLVEVLREWSTSKTVHLELDERLEMEREKVRRAGEMKLAAVAKELAKIMAVNEKTQEKLREAEIKLKDIPMLTADNQRKQQALTEVKEKLDNTENRLADRIKDYHDLQRVSTTQQNKISTLESTVQHLEQHVTTVASELQQEKEQKLTLDEYLRARTAERDRLNEHLTTLVDQEHRRLNDLQDVQVQYEPDNADHHVQTEFLTTPLEIKTILQQKQGQHAYAKFPLVYSQAIDVATSKPGTASTLLLGSSSSSSSSHRNHHQQQITHSPSAHQQHLSHHLTNNNNNSLNGGMYNHPMSTARTNRSLESMATSAHTTITPRHNLQRMNSSDSFIQQASGYLRLPPPVIHYDYDRRQQDFHTMDTTTTTVKLRPNQHSIAIGNDDNEYEDNGHQQVIYSRTFDDSYDADALNLQTPQDRPSSSATVKASSAAIAAGVSVAIGESAMDDDRLSLPLSTQSSPLHHHLSQQTQQQQASPSGGSVASTASKKVHHHHLIMPLSSRSLSQRSGMINGVDKNDDTAADDVSPSFPAEQQRYRQLAAQAMMARENAAAAALGSDGAALSLMKPSSAQGDQNRHRSDSYLDLSMPSSPNNNNHSNSNNVLTFTAGSSPSLPQTKKTNPLLVQNSYPLQQQSQATAGPSSSSSFQHHVPARVDKRIHEVRDGIVYQKRPAHHHHPSDNNHIRGPGKSTIGVFKGMTSNAPVLTPAQLQELQINMTQKLHEHHTKSTSTLPPLMLLNGGNSMASLDAPQSTMTVKMAKKKYQGPYKLDETGPMNASNAVALSKSTTSLGQVGLSTLQTAETLKKLQKEFF